MSRLEETGELLRIGFHPKQMASHVKTNWDSTKGTSV
jgi:hypothetical protein